MHTSEAASPFCRCDTTYIVRNVGGFIICIPHSSSLQSSEVFCGQIIKMILKEKLGVEVAVQK